MEALADGAGVGGLFEALAVFGAEVARDVDLDAQFPNPADGKLDHFLLDGHSRPSEIEVVPLCDDAHDGHHAGPERGGDEVGWGEGFSLAVVIDRGVGEQFVARRAVGGFTTQVALVHNLHFNHARDCGGRRRKTQRD